ncbi:MULTISPECIES: helix-turn-helix domain-containing protein [unclassified Micromonospora]|uniref:helix-turn-helix domain-containing protein n=1 Tax=unclassified Micromonospora TaxID=2617518 RepID=UPI00104D6B50|nr:MULTISPECIES: helix-turn-helix transcriptional regulator [unclassified Micromonospora]TDB74089.1 XRE family transcriptional regulator [Micromonospora sp. KC723]TDB79725.1 XRE family transcriptional regulator [Micromonospora sp. KC721]
MTEPIRSADEPPDEPDNLAPDPPVAGPVDAEIVWPVAGIVRAVRRRADRSQRELARAAGLHHGTVGRIEAGELLPSLAVLHRILAVGGFHLAVVDRCGRVLQPMRDRDDIRDGAERRYPAHLDTILDPKPGEWWADIYGLARPPETFYRNRAVRDEMRRRSQWEVRVAKYRNVPPPPRSPRSYW